MRIPLPLFRMEANVMGHGAKESRRRQIAAEEGQSGPARKPLRCRTKIVKRSARERDIVTVFSHIADQPFGWRIGLIEEHNQNTNY